MCVGTFQEKVLIGIAYDCLEKMVYWTDISTPAISKASLHGGEPISLITSGPVIISRFDFPHLTLYIDMLHA